MTKTASPPDPLLDHLQRLAAEPVDRGALADLRKGSSTLPERIPPEMHRHVEPYVPRRAKGWSYVSAYIVAALFADHPDPADQGNLGTALRRVAEQTDSQSIEQRFLALLKSHRDDLFDHLRHAVRLAASKGVPVNYRQLLTDLRYWDSEQQWVQRNWARQFWGSHTKTESEDQTTTEGDTE